jgi:hypothetical protein
MTGVLMALSSPKKLIGDSQSGGVTVVLYAHEKDTRLTMVGKIVGKGADRLPPLLGRIALPRLLPLDEVRFNLIEHSFELCVRETHQRAHGALFLRRFKGALQSYRFLFVAAADFRFNRELQAPMFWYVRNRAD